MIPLSLMLENSIGYYFFRSDEQGNILYMNNLLESHLDHIEPKSVVDFIKIEGDFEKSLDSCMKAIAISPYPAPFQCRLLQKTGVYRWSSWEIFHDGDVFSWLGGQLFDVVSITAHQYEEKCSLIEKILWFQNHKVRRPLSSILGVISLMEKTIDEETRSLVDLLSYSSKELDEVIKTVTKLASVK